MLEYISTLTVGEFFSMSAFFFVVTSGMIEIAPIKINPWSWIARRIGKAVNQDLYGRLDNIDSKVDILQHASEERWALDARTRILRFGDEILHGVPHSKEHFDQILEDVNRYEAYCDTHPTFRNNMTVITVKTIKENYMKCMTEKSFL